MHGTAIEIKAQKEGKKPKEFAQKNHKLNKETFKKYLVEFDNFHHTDSKENKELAIHFFNSLNKKGHIYKKQIEVVYGPASALYGTNAVSGIINIITNNPEDIQGGLASVLLGNFDTRNIDFRYGRYDQKNDFGFSLSGMFKQSDKADLGGAKGDNNWTENMENFEDDLSFDGKMTYKKLSMRLVFQDKQAEIY